ncbi:MAG: hypothetical protein AAF799_13245 [Myxococcota bacterium]
MDTTFIFAALSFFAVVTAVTAAMVRYRGATLVLLVLAALSFPALADTSDWTSWFDWAKRYSVMFPCCLWAWLMWRAESGHEHRGALHRGVTKLVPLLLALNVLEVAVLQFGAGQHLNAGCLVVLGLTTPLTFTTDPSSRVVGFRDAAWITAFTTSLTLVYLLDPVILNTAFGAIAILLIAGGAALFVRDSQVWIAWRSYTLVLLILQDSYSNALSDWLYPDFMHPGARAVLAGTPVEYGLLAVSVLSLSLVVMDRVQRFRSRR